MTAQLVVSAGPKETTRPIVTAYARWLAKRENK